MLERKKRGGDKMVTDRRESRRNSDWTRWIWNGNTDHTGARPVVAPRAIAQRYVYREKYWKRADDLATDS
jgi:hypothetical protein